MKILSVHNEYQIRGGEDGSREAKVQLLRSKGNDVREVIFSNKEIHGYKAALAGFEATWNNSSYQRILGEIDSWRPDLVDVDNFFPLVSPAVYYAANRRSLPVIQTLHNYRLLCPGAALFREGAVCEQCLGKTFPLPGIVHGCYRGNRVATAAVATMLGTHKLLGTWQKRVTTLIALTEFAKAKYIQGGLPASRIRVKPNFVPVDLGPGAGDGDYVFYVGRMSEEKGVLPLLDAWELANPKGRLLMAGDGPLSSLVEEKAQKMPSLVYLGRRPVLEIYKLMGSARAVVFPSVCYEGMPGAVTESLCRGTPVLASRLGSVPEMIREGETGWFVEAGNPASLAAGLRRIFDFPDEALAMRAAARAEYLTKYTPERNYELTMEIYNEAIGLAAGVR